MSITLRIDFGGREFEVSGTKQDVDHYLQQYAELLDEFRGGKAAPAADAPPAPVDTGPEFGEYLHRFPSELSDVDRVLLAGQFTQSNNDSKSFSTRDANEILLNQGVKVANASECVRRALASRKVFAVGKGEYRVSSQGAAYVQSLQNRTEE